MSAPVRKLKITHPDLSNPITVPLPWDSLTPSQQRELDALDSDDDGVLSYTPNGGGPSTGSTAEAHHANGTADRLNRILWGSVWTHPFNNRKTDAATRDDRWRKAQELQNAVFDQVVQPLLGDGNDPARWRLAHRILSETGDFAHLYRLAIASRARYEKPAPNQRNIDFLRIAEGLLLSAKRFAARVPAGRSEYFNRIEAELAQINPTLDRADRDAFHGDLAAPYLMATPGSPITADLTTLNQENGLVWFGVAVPKSFAQAHAKDLDAAIAEHLNQTITVTIRGSKFQDAEGSTEHRLTAVKVEKDAPGSADDPLDAQSSFHLDHARLRRTAFAGQEEMTFFRVGFRVTHPAEALGSRKIRRFDLLLKSDGRLRTISGGFVLQNMAGQTSRDVFASDVHISERDYEVVRVLAHSLRGLANRYEGDKIELEKIPVLRNQAEEVERFYESVNEQVEAAVDLWNDAYRKGEIHRVFLAGDLADFVNIAVTLEHRSYRGTNIRRLREILGRIEAPLYVASGNHDHHGQPFPLSLHLRNFLNADGLRDLYAPHFDDHRFPNSILYAEGVKGLLADTSRHEGWLADVIRELSADDPFKTRNDAFLDHHMRDIGIYETYGVGLGNNFRVFVWPTETEHFNYARYLLEEVHDPVTPGVLKGVAEYVGKQHPNGKGPRPENFVAFLREMEAAQKNGQRLILMGHYPAFFAGEGPDQTPDSVDTLRGDVAWALRAASWYYRNSSGDNTLALSVAGHVHHYAESDFQFHFKDSVEEANFRKELGAILAKKNAATLFDELHHLRHGWDLDNRIEIRRVQDSGSNGFPGPIIKDLNKNSSSYCKSRGTAYLTLPTLGIPTEEDSGYVVITTQPDGPISVSPHFLRVGTGAEIITADGPRLEEFRKERWSEAKSWDPARTMADFGAHTNPTAVSTTGPGVPGQIQRWDLLPVVYQYPRGKISLGATTSLGTNLRYGGFDWSVGGTLFVPLTHDIHTVFGGPNYLAFGAGYAHATKDLRLQLGLDSGIFTTYLNVDRVTRGNPILGAEIYLHGIFPHAGLTISGGSSIHGDWNGFIGIRIDQSILTYRMAEHLHF